MRILVIDDEPAVADLLADALRQDGHDPTVAASGELGLVAMEEMHPDAVFLDVAMPDMSGIEVLRGRLRQRVPLPHAPRRPGVVVRRHHAERRDRGYPGRFPGSEAPGHLGGDREARNLERRDGGVRRPRAQPAGLNIRGSA